MVSDIHLGEIIDKNRLEKMVDKINELKPDVVLLVGDMIDDRIEIFERNDMGQQFLKIKSKYGVYGVLGNHEFFGGNTNAVEMAYQNAGIICLVDEVTKVENSFYIVGRNDLSSRGSAQGRKTLEVLLKDVDKKLPIIVMDHQPNNFKEGQLNRIDIQFSGHTHGGQYFPNNIITKLMFEQHWGFIKKGNSSFIVSAGFGTWGPPIRIGTNSEMVNAVINFNDK